MEYSVKIRLAGGALALGAVLGVSIITSTIVASRAYEQRGRKAGEQNNQISVRGSARQRIVSDLGEWRIVVRGGGTDLPGAFRKVEEATQRVRQFLEASGVTAPEMDLSAIDTTTAYRRLPDGTQTRQVEEYVMERSFTITSSDVAKVARVSGEVTRLLEEGVQVSTARPSFYYTKLADLRVSILGDASADARARAEEIVGRTKSAIKELRQVQAGPFQVTVPNSMDVSGYGAYDTSTIEKDVSVSVTATFGVG